MTKYSFIALSLTGLLLIQLVQPVHAQKPAPLEAITIQAVEAVSWSAFDGTVEAVHQSAMAAQVPGRITVLSVKAGDTVTAGQLLLQIDADTADQSTLANQAQTQAARAALDLAAQDLQRQQTLYQSGYLSQAAYQRAQAQYRAAQAQFQAQQATTRAAKAQRDHFAVHAPYDGVVASVPASVGDMAMPGQTLLTVYQPNVLRVNASVPQSALSTMSPKYTPWLELPNITSDQHAITPTGIQVLPTIDPSTQTGHIRLDLPLDVKDVVPGTFARVWLASSTQTGLRIFVPGQSLVRHAEFVGVYVLTPSGQPLLRQVRLGNQLEDQFEVLSGVSAGEQVVLDPQAAAKWR